MSVIIRKAQKGDMPAIHGLVRELAIYEKAEEEFVVTIEEYERDFEDQAFEALLAEVEGQVVGMVLFYMTYSTWKGRMLYLEDFMVTAKCRQQGIGDLLWDQLLKEAKQRGVKANASLTKAEILSRLKA